MSRTVSLVQALRPRACRVAELLASRLRFAGLWQGYRASEVLEGELRFADLLHFHRPGQPHAVLVFRDPKLSDIRQVKWGNPIVLRSDVSERYASHIQIDQPVSYKENVSHTFSRTRTLLEAAKVAAEVAVKATVGTDVPIKGTLEVSAKISAEYSRQWGVAETRSDTVSREVSGTGPIKLDYEAVRSLNREKRTVQAVSDFEHSVELIDETGAGVNPPRIQLGLGWTEFLETVRGLAPRNVMTPNGRTVPNPFYELFIDSPLDGTEYDSLAAAPTGATVEFEVEYDNVLTQDIRIL